MHDSDDAATEAAAPPEGTPHVTEEVDQTGAILPPGVVLQASGLAKHFGPTQALRNGSLTLRRGEIHALMGENGSGKSTLVKLIAGVLRPDTGHLTVGGTELSFIGSPRAALQLGISPVFQEVLVTPQRSVLASVGLGADGLVKFHSSRQDRRREVGSLLALLLEDPPDLDVPVGTLPLSTRQVCCIARALLAKPSILVLDEATSALDVDVKDRLLRVLSDLRDQELSVLLISHRMDEIEEIADRVTVLRSGETVAELPRDEVDRAQLLRLMSGGDTLVGGAAVPARQQRSAGPTVLSVDDLTLRPRARPISIDLRAGQITGLAGLEGHGQDEFLRRLAGLTDSAGRVCRVLPDGSKKAVVTLREASRMGIAYVPRDRRDESNLESRSVLDNFNIASLHRDERRGFVIRARSRQRFRPQQEQLRIKLGTDRDEITTLSGGNQQKVIMARWFTLEPQILLLNDPTRGVDLNAKRDIYDSLRDAAERGCCVVMLSTEMDEHLELMDQVAVFHDQGLYNLIPAKDLTRGLLMASFFGQGLS